MAKDVDLWTKKSDIIGGRLFSPRIQKWCKSSEFSNKTAWIFLQPSYRLLSLFALSQSVNTIICVPRLNQDSEGRENVILQIDQFHNPVHCATKHRACLSQQLYKLWKSLNVAEVLCLQSGKRTKYCNITQVLTETVDQCLFS